MHYDVFNGDADGIIALLQLRLSNKKSNNEPKKEPKQESNNVEKSTLITGVKRDISLLKQVDVSRATSVTVLDISLEKNIDALTDLLNNNVEVFYVDHHRAGNVPQSEKLTYLLDLDANTCTSLLVNEHLQGEFATWAVAAAFGDNMQASAIALANKLGLTDAEQSLLQELGIYINYNGYGSSLDDLHFHPADLYQQLLEYPNPFDLIYQPNSVFSQLKTAYLADMAKAKAAEIIFDDNHVKALQLADEPWARRVSGVFGNELANAAPDKAHVVLTLNSDKSYTISLRAPLNNKQGAGELCAQFPTGGGRAAAAGINALSEEMLGDFIERVSKYYT
ncbi:acetyltransferase [Colwellia sp. 39_35_sub15_T18]|nr:acetyltransferase [Colwellia sp. 39_35_sub15_T18]